MLTAAIHKKLKRETHLWEDEVTSCVFGEMRYLPAADVWHFFNRLFSSEKRTAVGWPDFEPDRAEFHFWRRGKVEPDLAIDFYRQGLHQASLLIEVKWDAKLSPKCELVRQWSDWPHKEIPTFHLYLVKDSASGHAEIQQSLDLASTQCASLECPNCDVSNVRRFDVKAVKEHLPRWQQGLHCIGWRNLVSLENDLSSYSPHGRRWALELNAFLKKYGFEIFTGFEWLDRHPWGNTHPEISEFYNVEPWFSFLEGRESDLKPSTPVFFHH